MICTVSDRSIQQLAEVRPCDGNRLSALPFLLLTKKKIIKIRKGAAAVSDSEVPGEGQDTGTATPNPQMDDFHSRTRSAGRKEEDSIVPYAPTAMERAADKACWTTFVATVLLICGLVFVLGYNAWETPKAMRIRVHSFEYFVLCMLGGVLSGLPHTILTPFDLVKCRLQVGEYNGIGDGFSKIYNEAASSRRNFFSSLISLGFRGWAPTFVGYSLQGALKFGLYEIFKFVYTSLDPVFAHEHKVALYLAASASAELVADVALCPWEAVKIKMQTTRLYPAQLNVVIPRMWAAEGFHAFFKSITPLWGRQVPYTMIKFSVFEKIVEFLYSIFPKDISHIGHLLVSLTAGLLAGALCALCTHPADTLVSKVNHRSASAGGEGKGMLSIAKDLGCRGLWKGLVARLLFVAMLTAMQWLIYDSFKVYIGLPTTGSKK